MFQGTGFPILIGLAGDILDESFLDKDASSMIVGAIVVMSAAISVMLVNKCHRKTLLTTSSMGVSASLFVLGMYFYLKQRGISSGLTWLPIVTFVSYICFFMVIIRLFEVICVSQHVPYIISDRIRICVLACVCRDSPNSH